MVRTRAFLSIIVSRCLIGMGIAHLIGAFVSQPWHHPITFALLSFAAALMLEWVQAIHSAVSIQREEGSADEVSARD